MQVGAWACLQLPILKSLQKTFCSVEGALVTVLKVKRAPKSDVGVYKKQGGRPWLPLACYSRPHGVEAELQ